ncbi:MAG TPA: diacylglycerol kinase family protein [Actinomycetota bacterium]|nr:diacylglycerol kinase family protein [Actinomycetota bacterium]
MVNRGSGSNDETPALEERLRDRLPDVRSVDLTDQDVGSRIEEAAAAGHVVVAVGGDGSANSVAQHVVGRGTLAVLPAGTLNHFARDLGLADMDAAVDALESGHTRLIDVGRLKERYFLNNTGIGLYPELVYQRERAEDSVGKWRAAAGAALRVMRRSAPVTGWIEADGDRRTLFAWMVFVGNNRFGTTPGRIGQRERLDEGILDVGLFLAGPRGARRSSLAWRVFRSRPWQTSRRVVRRTATRVSIRLAGSPRQISWDGEAGERVRELDAEIVPRALRVIVPPPEET